MPPVFFSELSDDVVCDFAKRTHGDLIATLVVMESYKIPNTHQPDMAMEVMERCMARSARKKVGIDSPMVRVSFLL